MIKLEKILLDEYLEVVEQAMKQFGLRICSNCKRATLPIKRQEDGRFYYMEEMNCGDHQIFDLIFANTIEGRKLYLNDRRN